MLRSGGDGAAVAVLDGAVVVAPGEAVVWPEAQAATCATAEIMAAAASSRLAEGVIEPPPLSMRTCPS